MADMGDFWVFGYGSLMWRPGFDHVETQRARLFGYKRSLCIISRHYRGTPERTGLVLGLDRGGSCVGVAFRVAGEKRDETITYLRERELISNAYNERMVDIVLHDGTRVSALTYLVNRAHEQYSGVLTIEEAAARVSGAVGNAGPNEEYVHNTVEHIRALGIRDRWLEGVAEAVRKV
jgi:glutathione-specific gamma-glutamylcyclotransferase